MIRSIAQCVATLVACILLGVFTTAMVGCAEEGELEKAGEKADEKLEEAGEALEEAGDDAGKAIDDLTGG